MPKVNLLPKQVAELIAAGEVVERPASVIKELVENSIDAGATSVAVEIMHGGITYMRVTDDGCGIEHTDVPTAFLRHATSKINSETDLNSIATLGFRGEALAAVSSVAKVELYTKTVDEDFGSHYIIESGEEFAFDNDGCPDGTTIIIRDLFFNTPARMKFLKKDVSEGNAVSAVIDRIALSHPEISFKYIKDGKTMLSTAGDNVLKNAVYSVLGRDFSANLTEVDYNENGITVNGLICKPFACHATRNHQFTFLNGRFVKSGTVMAAVEQAYKNSIMVGKYPGFVLKIGVPYETVDVNVHPAKTEVRFSDEKRIFDAVYAAVKSAIIKGDTRPEISVKQKEFQSFDRITSEQYRAQIITETAKKEPVITNSNYKTESNKVDFLRAGSSNFLDIKLPEVENSSLHNEKIVEEKPIIKEQNDFVKVIGQVFSTYIVAEKGNSIFLIDKHAAHERINFNNLKNGVKAGIQELLTPAHITLTATDYDTIIDNIDLLNDNGFDVEDFGNQTIVVRSMPSNLSISDVDGLIEEVAFSLRKSATVQIEKLDNLYHTVACKAAIKAGSSTSLSEMQQLAERVLNDNDIMYCPHGRPVAFEIKKAELEKKFGRIQ